MKVRYLVLAALVVAVPSLDSVAADMANPPKAWFDNTDRVIVKYKSDVLDRNIIGRSLNVQSVDGQAVRMAHVRRLYDGIHVFKLPTSKSKSQLVDLIQALKNDKNIEYVEPDYRMYALMQPNDARYNEQWDFTYTSTGINAEGAWDKTQGAGAVVAVVDTGITSHSELNGQRLPGYDFISDAEAARDGDGRDNNPSDEGDWMLAGECGFGYPKQDTNNSWHGTHVAGTVVAATNNGIGVAGVAHKAKLLPVRVLGKCGGYTSDIVDGMRWSAGLSVSGVPANQNPADVINLSLGGAGVCSATFQNAINQIRARGTSIVVAAGNAAEDASNTAPASCVGVIAVAATTRQGGLASYSNYGSVVDLSAPGGQLSLYDATGGILSTYNNGARSLGSESYQYLQGTSMASPHVAGIAALVYSVKPTVTPDELETALKSSVKPFPAVSGASQCTTSKCGAGIVDAAAVVALFSDVPTEDNEPPLVSVTSPQNQSSVSGNVSIEVHATDNVGVSRVEFYIADQYVGADSIAPFRMTWDTTTYGNGQWSIEVKAFDAAGNFTTSEPVVAEVANGDNQWSCVDHLSSNVAHVSAGRATANWYYTYAKGSGQYIGWYSSWGSVPLAETSPGYFEYGYCP